MTYEFKMISFKCIIIGAILIVASMLIEEGHCCTTQTYIQERYAVIIDAGSSGTRIAIYKFILTRDPKMLILASNYSYGLDIALSCFASRISDLAPNLLDPLLSKAKTIIPESFHANTPITLMATAGLRLMNKNESDSLLQAVSIYLEETGFLILDEKDKIARIISGTEEAVYGWLSVNYLLKNILSTNYSSTQTTGFVELGGASSQMAFQITKKESISYRRKFPFIFPSPVVRVTLGKQIYILFAYSFLGYGLHQGRIKTARYFHSHASFFQGTEDIPKIDGFDCYSQNFTFALPPSPLGPLMVTGSKEMGFKKCSHCLKQLFRSNDYKHYHSSTSYRLIQGLPFTPLSFNKQMDTLYGVSAFSYFIEPFVQAKTVHMREIRQLARDVCLFMGHPNSMNIPASLYNASNISGTGHKSLSQGGSRFLTSLIIDYWSKRSYTSNEGFDLHLWDSNCQIKRRNLYLKSANILSSPFLCHDLTYILTLLEEGYRIGSSNKMIFQNFIDGCQASWTLGAAINVILNDKYSRIFD